MAFISRDLTQKLFACGQCTITPRPDCTPTPRPDCTPTPRPDCTPTPPDCTPTPPDCTPTPPPDNCTPTPGDEGKHPRRALGELRQQLREALAQNP